MPYEIDHELTSDETVCENCGTVVDKLRIIETCEGKGCTECILNCAWCGKSCFNDMYGDPYFGTTCQACLNGEEYRKALREEVLKEALQCLFDQTPSRQIERIIVDVARGEGFFEKAHELKNDL